jgi:hypothetical protein
VIGRLLCGYNRDVGKTYNLEFQYQKLSIFFIKCDATSASGTFVLAIYEKILPNYSR